MIDDVRSKYNVSEDMFGNMLVAVTEAVTNAIYHGNKGDASKKVHVKYALSNHHLSFTITDQGPGCDFYNLPDPTAPENLEKECGRGIFLMKHLTDQFWLETSIGWDFLGFTMGGCFPFLSLELRGLHLPG